MPIAMQKARGNGRKSSRPSLWVLTHIFTFWLHHPGLGMLLDLFLELLLPLMLNLINSIIAQRVMVRIKCPSKCFFYTAVIQQIFDTSANLKKPTRILWLDPSMKLGEKFSWDMKKLDFGAWKGTSPKIFLFCFIFTSFQIFPCL